MEKKLMLDAGHGGKDPGATKGSRTEANDVLKLAKAIRAKILEDYTDIKAGMTRTTDIYESPTKKAQDANSFGADLFVSLHRDSFTPLSNGYSSLVYSNSGKAKKLADKLNARMAEIGFKKRGTVERTGLAVLKHTNMPALLGENGFISNKKDNERFDSKFDEIVEAYALSIAEVLDLKKKAKKKRIKIAHATNGSEPIKGGTAGDQGGEVFITQMYDRGWNYVIRFDDSDKREKIAQCFEMAARNDNIGYDQSQRNTLFDAAKKVGYNPSRVAIKCETDCSALASLACVYADNALEGTMYPSGKGSTTRNFRERISKTGEVKILTGKKYFESDDYAIRGDLYLADGKHIVCVLENGKKAQISAGSTVKIKEGAVYGGAASGKKVPDQYVGKSYTVTKVATHEGVREALLKELNSWVPEKHLE